MASEEAPEGIPGLRYDRRAAITSQQSLRSDLVVYRDQNRANEVTVQTWRPEALE